jgi:hypothetical protein
MRVPSCLRLFHSRKLIGACAALMVASSAIPPAQAGFLEDLFGDDDAPRQAAPPPRAAARPARRSGAGLSSRLNEVRKATRSKAAREADGDDPNDHREYVAGSRPHKPRLCGVTEQARTQTDHSADYLRDETLHAGDSIVTDRSIIVFRGNSACPHTAADFVPLAQSGLPKAQRNALADLERAMRSPARRFSIEKQAAARVVGQINQ